ncbi:MAG: GNAT family N-acetyltransferase [Arcobacteraceae bacterium]|jgi:N-acetylglutamate synthase-like GNAT family acetyltransferase|nr:GNAT family N-acetyltransferase [Arcobacteraceae bacterium]
MKIRKAKLKDINEITNLLEVLFTQEGEFEFNTKLHQKGLKKIIQNKKVGTIFVALKDKKVIACVNILYTISTALGSKVVLLEDMIVNPQYQNQGIGKKLLSNVLEYLKNKKIQRVTLLTDGDNLKGHNFYKSLGFKQSSMRIFRQRIVNG